MDEDVQIRPQPVLETPITPLPGVEELQVFLSVGQTVSEHVRVRQNSVVKDQECRYHVQQMEIPDREHSGPSANLQKVK